MDGIDLEQQVQILRDSLVNQLGVLKRVCGANLSGRAYEVRIVVASACSTGSALCELGKKPEYFYAEMMMLARSLIEKLTNYCYLQICSEEEFEKFLLHPYYKSFHNSDRFKSAGFKKMGLQYSGKESLKSHPQTKRALEIFSEINPKKNWSDLNIDRKVEDISRKTNLSVEFFLLNTLTIYSNASEALHGTLYGCALPTGAFTPGVKSDDVASVHKNVLQNAGLIYVQLSSIIHELIKLLTGSFTDLSPLLLESQSIIDIQVRIMKSIFQVKKD
jgi:hypothetical protein